MALVESTKAKALKEGKILLQSFGYNGFSFQHLADALGLRKQSLYVHFKSKEDLASDLIEDYIVNFKTWSDTVEVFGPEEKIHAWFDRFYKFANDDFKYCPVGALASDYHSLPKPIQKKLSQAAGLRQQWLVDIIEEGQKKKVFRKDFKKENLAQLAIVCCFGSQQLARLANDAETIRSVQQDLLKILKGN